MNRMLDTIPINDHTIGVSVEILSECKTEWTRLGRVFTASHPDQRCFTLSHPQPYGVTTYSNRLLQTIPIVL